MLEVIKEIVSQIFPFTITLMQIFLTFTLIITLLRIRVHWVITLLYAAVLMFLTSENQWIMLAIFFGGSFTYYFLATKRQLKLTILAMVLHLFSSQLVNSVLQFVFLGLIFFIEVDGNFIRIFSIFVYVVLLVVIKYKDINLTNLINHKMIFRLSVAMMLISLVTYTYAPITIEEFLNPDNIHSLFLVAIIQFVVIYMAFTLNKFVTEVEKQEQHKLYIKTLEASLDNWSMYKHDASNMISTLSGFCRLKRWDKLETYIKEIANDMHKEVDVGNINFYLKDNIPCLYGIVLAKSSEAARNHINFDVKVTAKKFELKAANELQVSRMVGILLDNALEAAKQATPKEVILKISNVKDDRLKIEVTNYVDAPVDTTKLLEKGYTTKKEHSGLGLYEIQSIVEQQREEGLNVGFNINNQGNIFIVELLV